jgi:CubicO group peptidase (beta-lactamase class C family)
MRLVTCCSLFLLSFASLAQTPDEFPTTWEVPPGDPLEHMTAGYAKVLCSAVFSTGRDLETAKEEDGFFVAPREMRSAVSKIEVDRTNKAVLVSLPNGVTRVAKIVGDQGCVILPRGKDAVFFKPVKIRSTLPDPETTPWPMGDRLPDSPLPSELDMPKVAAATEAAFAGDSLTAAYVVAYKGRIIAERYGPGIDSRTPLPSWSMGKSVAGSLMGVLIQKGLYFPWQPAPVDEWQKADDPRRKIKIEDLLRMSSGLRFIAPQDPDYDPSKGYPDHLYIYTGAIDAVKWAVTRPPQWAPNTVGRYRNSDPLVINYLIRRALNAVGEEYLSFPQRYLFDKIGIRSMVLEADAYGNLMFQGYDLGTGRDWMRLALLYQRGGVWNGEQILPRGWSRFVSTPSPAWSQPVYGAFFWLNRTGRWPVPEDAYFMAGAGGQYAIIIPTHDLAVVRLGHYKGQAEGDRALRTALGLLIEAVPQVREPVPMPEKR